MTLPRGNRHSPPRVIGTCYSCREPVRTGDRPIRLYDRTVGVYRLCHPGTCADHVERLLLTAGGGVPLDHRKI